MNFAPADLAESLFTLWAKGATFGLPALLTDLDALMI
jgi:hypothetical protein